MYMNKNKTTGFSLIEMIVSLTLMLIMFQVIYYYFKQINIEKRRLDYKFSQDKNLKLILNSIDNLIYQSKEYKIYKLKGNEIIINYNKPSLNEGNALIIEEYIPNTGNTKTYMYIYNNNFKYIYSSTGTKNIYGIIEIDFSSNEIILERIDIKFIQKNYGILMEGYYKNEKIKKEFKK